MTTLVQRMRLATATIRIYTRAYMSTIRAGMSISQRRTGAF